MRRLGEESQERRGCSPILRRLEEMRQAAHRRRQPRQHQKRGAANPGSTRRMGHEEAQVQGNPEDSHSERASRT